MKAVNLQSFDNSCYRPGSFFKRFCWYCTNEIFFRNRFFLSSKIKILFLKLFGARIGVNVILKPGLNIKFPWNLSIGNNCWIGENVWIDNLAYVKLGNNVCLSQGSMLICGNHNYKKSTFDLIVKPIYIEDGAWIGAKSIVCPGITVKSHSILTVGSVATNDLDSFGIYKGNPAKKYKLRVIE